MIKKTSTVGISSELLEELQSLKNFFKVKSKEGVILHWKKLANKYIQYRRSKDYKEIGVENPTQIGELLEIIRNDQRMVIWEELKALRKDINKLRNFRMQVVDTA